MEQLVSNVFDCALVFEGGGYRGAYTAGMVSTLIENQVWFDYVCGVSAGASHTFNYVSRDQERARFSFMAIDGPEPVGGLSSLLHGKGYFNADYLYEGCLRDGTAPFDWETFVANPAQIRIQAFERDNGRTVRFGKQDMSDVFEAFKLMRASSTIPGAMKPEPVEGKVLLDGGLGIGAGIPVPMAEADGFERFVFVTTRVAGYRKKPFAPMVQLAFRRAFGRYPYLYEALLTRAQRYNEALDHVSELEQSGNALVVRPDVMPIKNATVDAKKLEDAYKLGHKQAQREIERIMRFVGLA